MRLIVIFLGIALAAGAFVLTSNMMSRPHETPLIVQPTPVVREPQEVQIYTAKSEIPIGTIITPEMLDIQRWPKHLMLDDMVQAEPNAETNIVSMVSRTPFQKGEPIFMSKLGNDKDPSFLAAALPKGMRVITIAVDSVSGVGNFITPGDRVDVFITHDVALDGIGEQRSTLAAQAPEFRKAPITEVMLSNTKVLAVNQRPVAHRSGEQQQQQPLTNVSLEVTASEAQKVRLAENGNGRLSLALRSLKDRDENELSRPTGLSDLSRLTPPTYFSTLYDDNSKPTASPVPAATPTEKKPSKSFVNVVRGTKSEPVEVTQP